MRRIVRVVGLALSVMAGVALSVGNAWGLNDEEIFREFRFNFINPGARSVGMGGAFVAAAEDATAAGANPAALHYVNQIEAFAEYRGVTGDDQTFQASRGTLKPLDDLELPFLELQTVTAPQDNSFVSFASFVYPFKIGRRRATIAVSHQVLLDTSLRLGETFLEFSAANFPLYIDPDYDPNDPDSAPVAQYSVANTVQGALDAQIFYENLSFEFSITRDFSLGITATYATLDMNALTRNVSNDPRGILTTFNPRLDPDGDGNFENVLTETRIDDKDSAFTYLIGLHWHPDTSFPSGLSPIRFGVVYRRGAEFTVQQQRFEATDVSGSSMVPTGPPFSNTLKVPDQYALGIAYYTPEHWVFSFDVERVKYSDLLKNFSSGVNFLTGPTIPLVREEGGEIKYDVDDATVFRAGVEYTHRTRGRWILSGRLGYFNEPDSRIRMVEFDAPDAEPVYLDAFRGGDDDNHLTAGFSFGLPAGHRVDLAADFSDRQQQYVVSAILRFGRIRR